MDKVPKAKLYSPANPRVTQFKTNVSHGINLNLCQVKKNILFRRKISFQKPFSELLLRSYRPGLGHMLIPQLQGKLGKGVGDIFTSTVVMGCSARKKG